MSKQVECQDHGALFKSEHARPGRPLQTIAEQRPDLERKIMSQYHAVGAVSGCYMLRRGRWKCIEYAGFEPELFELSVVPEELTDVAADKPYEVDRLGAILRNHVVPETVEVDTFAAQDKLIESLGGFEAALTVGRIGGGTPPPRSKQT